MNSPTNQKWGSPNGFDHHSQGSPPSHPASVRALVAGSPELQLAGAQRGTEPRSSTAVSALGATAKSWSGRLGWGWAGGGLRGGGGVAGGGGGVAGGIGGFRVQNA